MHGFLVPPDDVLELSNTISSILGKPINEIRQLLRDAYNFTKSKHMLSGVASRYAESLKGALNESKCLPKEYFEEVLVNNNQSLVQHWRINHETKTKLQNVTGEKKILEEYLSRCENKLFKCEDNLSKYEKMDVSLRWLWKALRNKISKSHS